MSRDETKRASSSEKKRKLGTTGRNDKRNKGHEKGTNKAEARGKEAEKSDRGWRGKEIGSNVHASKTADVRPTFWRQVSLLKMQKEKERQTDGMRDRNDKMLVAVCVYVQHAAETRIRASEFN